MTQTQTLSDERPPRRHVVGYIISSLVVGVVGLVAAIALTISGTLHTFTNVSETYEHIYEDGEEIGPDAAQLELDDANYAIVSFSNSPEPPPAAEQSQACSVTDQYGDPVPTEDSAQEISETEAATADYDLSEVNYVIYHNFEARQGTYEVACQDFGLLSDGTNYNMGGTAIGGILLGIGSMIVAAVLFVIGIINHTRNRNTQRNRSQKLIEYRLDAS